jgi:ubiquinone/menaquinone biosynthesis C-methylase UbiE
MTVSTFGGPVAEFYARFRRGYPEAVVARLTTALDLNVGSRVLDVGCGTGQLTIPLSARVHAALGVDVEPDMLRFARRAALEAGARNVAWLLASDAELDVVSALAGEHVFDAATIGQALHWMDAPGLFRTLHRLVRPGGGVAVITNGEPQWLLDTGWSRALRAHLEAWLRQPLTARCGTDRDAQHAYRQALANTGFTRIEEITIEHHEALPFDTLVGSVYSAMTPETIPTGQERETFETRLRAALGAEPYLEDVHVTLLAGRSDTG